MALIVYGIKNCNTVKSALQWLTANNIDFLFHDFKSRGISHSKLKDWCTQLGWETLVNKRGTTWRQLDAGIQGAIKDETSGIALMNEKTSVIKRPVLELNNEVIGLGYDPAHYGQLFKKTGNQ